MENAMRNQQIVSNDGTAQSQPETGFREVSVQCHRHQDPVPGMDPQVTLELLTGGGRKKAIGHVTVYHAISIHGIAVMEKNKRFYVKMPRAPKGARARHSDIVYPLNQQARDILYDAVLQQYNQLAVAVEAERKKSKFI